MESISDCVNGFAVAPLVGAWIEIERADFINKCIRVAPLVGAWIEILFCIRSLYASLSLLL